MPASSRACERRVLLKPGLRLMGVRRTSSTRLTWAESRDSTKESMSRPLYPADDGPWTAGWARRNRSSRDTSSASASAPTVRNLAESAPALQPLQQVSWMPASFERRSGVHARSSRRARTRAASVRAGECDGGVKGRSGMDRQPSFRRNHTASPPCSPEARLGAVGWRGRPAELSRALRNYGSPSGPWCCLRFRCWISMDTASRTSRRA